MIGIAVTEVSAIDAAEVLSEETIRRHDRAVWLAVVAMGLPPADAREIVQATWARLVEQIRRGAVTDVQLPGLAITQARFLALEELRRRRREQRRHTDVAELELAKDEAGADRALVTREQLARVLGELATCSAQQQQIFRLVYEDALPHAEVAARVDLSVQRVRQILCEVRRKLRGILEEAPQ